jgi:hypothetical protein
VEVTERRNLFVHKGGEVSAQYLKVCRAHKVDVGQTARGKLLRVSPKYFDEASRAIFEVGVKLAHVLWRKIKPSERADADKSLVVITYDLLVQGKYQLAKTMLDFATEVIKQYSSENCRLRFVVNRVQAYKWSGEAKRALEILDEEDFSALGSEFKLAELVLRDDFQSALQLVREIGASGPISLEDYREWPLFIEFRKLKELDEIILEIFKEPLNKVSVPQENLQDTGGPLQADPMNGGRPT